MAGNVVATSQSQSRAAAVGFRLPGSVRNVLAVAEREIRSYFVSPVAWVVAAVFIALWGYLFAGILVTSREADLRPLLNNFSVTFLFIGPFLTMRLLAEEARTGTLELLLTQPLRDAELVIG